MRHDRPILLPIVLTVLVAACSAPATSSQGGGESSTAAESSEEGQPSDAGGGGGGSGTNGSIQYEITGDHTESGELRFVPEASYFEQNGITYLSFANEGESTVLFLSLSDGGNTTNFGSQEVSIVSTPENCTFNLERDDASGASGTFDCPNSFAVFASGTQQGTVTIKGTFEATP
jgi:hypothetical protein